MAKIYAVGASGMAIDTPHFAERPLKELLDQIKVSRSDKWSESGPVTSSGSQPADARAPAFFQIEVDGNEGERLGWKDGWHLVHLTPEEAKKRLALVFQ